MFKNYYWTKTDQTVRKQHGQLSEWLHYEEDSIVYLSLSHMSEPLGLKRDRKCWGKTSVARADKVIEDSM